MIFVRTQISFEWSKISPMKVLSLNLRRKGVYLLMEQVRKSLLTDWNLRQHLSDSQINEDLGCAQSF